MRDEEWRGRLLSGDATVSQFLESKRRGLLSDSPDEREESLAEIVSLVCGLPVDYLAEDQVALLLEFLLGRLETSALAGGCVVTGIHHLILKCVNLPANFEMPVYRFMFKEGNVQSWPQSNRRLQFEILQWLLQNRLDLLKQLGSDFVATFVKTIAEERDPRCLDIVFRLFVTVSNKFDMGRLTEEMFETIACYFPIEFRPLADKTITRPYLASCCQACLTASPAFADFCYLLIDEKFNDDECSAEQKDDVCSLLCQAATVFPPTSITPHLKELLGGIRIVALDPQNRGSVSQKVYDALTAVLRAVARTDNPKLEWMCADSLIENLEPFVLQAEMGLTSRALSLLKCAAQVANAEAAAKVLNQTIAYLTTIVQGDTTNVAANRTDVMGEGLVALAEWVQLATQRADVRESVLTTYEGSVFASIAVARETVPSQAVNAFQSCATSYMQSGFVSDQLRENVRNALETGLHSVQVVEEFKTYLEMLGAAMKCGIFVIEDHLKALETPGAEDWNDVKKVAILCAAAYAKSQQDAFETVIATILKAFAYNSLGWKDGKINKDLDAYVDLCRRLHADEYHARVTYMVIAFDKHFEGSDFEVVWDEMSLAKCLQSLTLYLSEDERETWVHQVASRGEHIGRWKYRWLSLLQTKDADLLRHLSEVADVHPKMRNAFRFGAVNRGAVKVDEQGLPDEIGQRFLVVKALLLQPNECSMKLFEELLVEVSRMEETQESTKMLEELFDVFLDYDRDEFNPSRCLYNCNPIWQQKLFYMMVPIYKRIFEASPNANLLLIFLTPLLEFGERLDAVFSKEQFAPLLPLVLASISEGRNVSPSILGAIPVFLEVADPLGAEDVGLLTTKMVAVSKGRLVAMTSLLECLESLSWLAKKQPPASLHRLVPAVVAALNSLLGHRKRRIRQKAATVKNAWEMMISK